MERAFPAFPHGFPTEFLDEFCARVGCSGWLCNEPASGTEVIARLGEEHLKTGKLIIYTSADSVFQIAAHESVVPHEQLWHICEAAREMLTG